VVWSGALGSPFFALVTNAKGDEGFKRSESRPLPLSPQYLGGWSCGFGPERYPLRFAVSASSLTQQVVFYVKFQLIDQLLECGPKRAVAIKNVSASEEYLADHFPSFPVLPGVFMLEAMVQAARAVLAEEGHERMMLCEVKALRYGTFVKPGESLRVEVELLKSGDGFFAFKGAGQRLVPGDSGEMDTAVSGRFTMRAATAGNRSASE